MLSWKHLSFHLFIICINRFAAFCKFGVWIHRKRKYILTFLYRLDKQSDQWAHKRPKRLSKISQRNRPNSSMFSPRNLICNREREDGNGNLEPIPLLTAERVKNAVLLMTLIKIFKLSFGQGVRYYPSRSEPRGREYIKYQPSLCVPE